MTNPVKIGLVLDCLDAERLAAFWGPALGYVNVGAFGSYIGLFPESGPAPKLLLQQVVETKTTKNRMHLDIETPHIQREATRLVALGATRVEDDVCCEHGSSWILMADPEGNEFCVCDAGQPATADDPDDTP